MSAASISTHTHSWQDGLRNQLLAPILATYPLKGASDSIGIGDELISSAKWSIEMLGRQSEYAIGAQLPAATVKELLLEAVRGALKESAESRIRTIIAKLLSTKVGYKPADEFSGPSYSARDQMNLLQAWADDPSLAFQLPRDEELLQ